MKDWQLGEADALTDDFHSWDITQMAYRLFYSTMPPWEYEEMGGLFYYHIAKIESVSNEMKENLRDLSKSTPCDYFWDILPIEQRPPGAGIEVEHDLVIFDEQHSIGLAGLGPEFLYRIVHLDRLSRRNVLCNNARPCYTPFIGPELGLSWDKKFPFIEPADRHDTPNFEQFWSTLSPLEQPTVGWKRAWVLPHNKEDILEDALDYDRKHEQDWEWGYALWDEKRLEDWKAPLLVENAEVGEVPESN
jgi:hypothetical protein